MANGIVRRIDELGRITLPMEIRRRYEIEEGNRLGINLDGKVIRISKSVTGMSRPVDELGRVTLPKEFRKTLGFVDKQPVDMWVEGEEICLRKDGKVCVFCGCNHVESLTEYKGLYICDTCLLELEAGL